MIELTLDTHLMDTASQVPLQLGANDIGPNKTEYDEFAVQTSDMKNAISFLMHPSRCLPHLNIDICCTAMRLSTQTQNGECFASARVLIKPKAHIERPIAIKTNLEIAHRVVNVLEEEATIRISTDRTEIWISIGEDWLPLISEACASISNGWVDGQSSITLNGDAASDALTHACALAPSYVPTNTTDVHGARLYNGMAVGGSSRAICLYESPALPTQCDIPVPHRSFSNARRMLRLLKTCDVQITENAVVLRNSALGFEGGWLTKNVHLPVSIVAAFDIFKPTFETRIDPWLLANRAAMHAIVCPRKTTSYGRFESREHDGKHVLGLFSYYEHGIAWAIYTEIGIDPNVADDFARVQFRMSDIGKGGYLLDPECSHFAISSRGLMLSSERDGIHRKILFAPEVIR